MGWKGYAVVAIVALVAIAIVFNVMPAATRQKIFKV